MSRKDKQQAPSLYIELMDSQGGRITLPANTIFDIILKQNCAPDKDNHSKVVVIRLNPDNSRSSIIAVWYVDKNPYHEKAAEDYYNRLTTLIGAIKLNQWNRPTPPTSSDDSGFDTF